MLTTLEEIAMTNQEILSASSAILKKAKQFGVHLAGYADADDLKLSPSYITAPHIPVVDRVVGTLEGTMKLNPGEVQWPKEAKSILVIAVEHPENKPELDWWYGQISPPGNTLMINAVKALCEWISANFDINVNHFPYFIEQGGIYLKDAAVMAGLGCIGRNNMVVTPEFGPRVRLRAMSLSIPIPSTGPSRFDPCVRCDDLCRKACPQHSFDEQFNLTRTCEQVILPGRDGSYAHHTCYAEMKKNKEEATEAIPEGFSEPVKLIKCCRICEWSCPVGK